MHLSKKCMHIDMNDKSGRQHRKRHPGKAGLEVRGALVRAADRPCALARATDQKLQVGENTVFSRAPVRTSGRMGIANKHLTDQSVKE